MAKKNTIITLGAALCVLLVIQLTMNFSGNNAPSFREALEQKLATRSDIDDRRKEVLRIQLSVRDWMSKHNNTPPHRLQQLVPEYFEMVPTDPITGKAFSYMIKDEDFSIGEPLSEETPVATSTNPPQQKTNDIPGATTLIASTAEKEDYIYDPEGKRDPFLAFDFSPSQNLDGRTELEQFEIGQLRLTATLEGLGEPKAIVESSTGKGFTVTVGTRIGPNNGEVVQILKDRLIIVESETDFTGETKMNTIEMLLRLPGQGRNQGSRKTKTRDSSRKASFR